MRAVKKTQRRKDAMMRLRRMRRMQKPPTPRRFMAWIVWGVSALFVLFQFSLQLSSGEMVNGLMTSFHLDALGAGVLASTYYYVYALLQSPAGMVVDRFGPRKILSIGAAICGMGTLVFAGAHSVTVAIFGRLLMGSGAAFAFVGSLYLVGKWFPIERFAFMVGVAEAIGMVGSLLGGVYMADFVEHVGWRSAMFGAAGLAALIAVMIALIVRDTPYKTAAPKSLRPKGAFRRDFKRLLRNKNAWLAGCYSGAMFACVTVFVALWGIPYLQLVHHVTLMGATFICNMVFIGVAIGTPIVGWLDAKVNRRILLVSTAIANTILVCLVIYMTSLPTWALTGLMLILGISCSSYVIPFAIAHEISTPSTRSTYMGFINMLQVGFAPIFQPLIGLVMSLVATGFYHHAGHAYTVYDYKIALSIVPMISVAALLIARVLPLRTPPVACVCDESEQEQEHAVSEKCPLIDQPEMAKT